MKRDLRLPEQQSRATRRESYLGTNPFIFRLSSIVFLLVFALAPFTASAQSKTLYWQRLDADITVQANGDLRVLETQEIVFTNGVFTSGSRGIDTSRLTDIRDVQVSEGDRVYSESPNQSPYTYEIDPSSSEYTIKWHFLPAVNETRTFQIAYTARGTVRFYPDGDQIWWMAVFPTRPFPVRNSTVTVHLPEGATVVKSEAMQTKATVENVDDRSVRFVAQAEIPANQGMEVRVQFPHSVIQGTPAPWQATVDAQQEEATRLEQQQRQTIATQQAQRAMQDAEATRTRPLYDLIFGGVSLLLAVGGPLGVYLWWYGRGRQKPVGLIADYLPEPPSDLPAAEAGTLIDERAGLQELVGGIMDLARQGVLTITEGGGPDSVRKDDFLYRRTPKFKGTLRPFDKTLVEYIFGSDSERKLSTFKTDFARIVPRLKQEIYDDLIAQGLLTGNPETAQSRIRSLGWILFGLSFLVSVCAFLAVGATTSIVALCIPFGLAITGLALVIASGRFSSKTPQGAEAGMRWQAFMRYLQNIEKYTKLDESHAIFEKYLPYAVAFGLEKDYVNKFAAVRAPAPAWLNPVPRVDSWNQDTFLDGQSYDANSTTAGRGVGDLFSNLPVAPGSGSSFGGGSQSYQIPSSSSSSGDNTPFLDRAASSSYSSLNEASSGLFSILNAAADFLSSGSSSSSSSSSWSSSSSSGSSWSGGGSSSSGGGSSGGGWGGFS